MAPPGAGGRLSKHTPHATIHEFGDWMVRAEAIQWLGERRVVRAIPSVLRRLETEQDEFVRDGMLRTLSRLED